MPRADAIGVESLLAPADHLRARLYRLLGPALGRYVSDRELRGAVLGVIGISIALLLAVGAPLWLLALGPILLGVPHVMADLRYLWVQPGHHKRVAVWLLVVPLLGMAAYTAQVSWGLGAATLALFAVPSTKTRRAIGVAVLVPLTMLSIRWTGPSQLIFAHAHNLVAVALWWTMYRRGTRWHWLVLAMFVGASLFIATGSADPLIQAGMRSSLEGRSIAHHARHLAPWTTSTAAVRMVVLFAFAQSVHYAIWLRLVPEEARTRPSPRPFRSSYRALRSELGIWLLVLATVAALALAVWATMDLWSARDGYLRAAIFHGHLELAAAALLFAGGRAERGA
jgi:hypothetical protein